MEELLYRYNPWWEGKYSLEGIKERPEILSRLIKLQNTKQIVFLTGLRRVGKTTFLKLLIKYFIDKENFSPKRIFYVSMDDYLLSNKSILEIIDEYRKIHKIKVEEKIYLFLDEIAYKQNFEQQLKNIYDTQNVKIYASSSSASIIKSKKPLLTGRNIIVEVLPLTFQEYLNFKGIVIKKMDAHLTEKYFEEFLENGGLPEYVLHKDPEYIRELVDDVIYKDIAGFHNIRDPQVIKDFFLLLMERAGKIVSINKLSNILDISVDSAKRYLSMFVDTFLIYLVPRFGKTNQRILAPKKIYAADLGIRNIFTGFRDKGSLFENYLFLKIKNLKPSYIYENGIEIDFFTSDKILIEVKYKREMTEKQKKLFDRFPANRKIILTDFNEIETIISG